MADDRSNAAISDKLAAIVGQANVITDQQDLTPWLTDWRQRVTGHAIAMAMPRDAEQVRQIVRLALDAGIPIVPQGGNTGMVAGGVPRPGDDAILLSLRKMDAIRAVDRDDTSLIAEAGAILSDVHRAAENHDLRFPLSLAAKDSATIGGLISTNAGGTQVLRFGTMRALTLGIEAVLPDGSLFEGLSTLRKDNRGYDLKQLLIGAEGTLGIVTAASLKLYPAAAHREVAWVGLADPGAALALLRKMKASLGEAVESFELIPDTALQLVLAHIPGTRAPLSGAHIWHILAEARTGADPDRLRAGLERVLAAGIESGEIQDAALAASEAQAEDLWKLRESISEAERIDGIAAKHDVSVPVSAMPGFIVDATRKVERSFDGARVIAFGHLGDGNVHFNVRAPAGGDADRWFAEQAEPVGRLVHDLVVARGGSLSAEHGIGLLKRDEFMRLAEPVRIRAMRSIKTAIDPAGIMNPGKLLP